MRAAAILLFALTLPMPSVAAPEPTNGLDGFFLRQGLARLVVHGPDELAAEAREATAWATARSQLSLGAADSGFTLSDGKDTLTLSPGLATALRRLNDYMGLSTATRLQPIPTADLRAAALHPAAVANIRALFDRALSAAILIDGEPIVPELGGDVLLIGKGMELREFADPTREALSEVAARQDDPEALAELFAEDSESLQLLDVTGQLAREVELFAERAERGVPLERRRRPFDMAVETILRNGSDTFTMHPRAQVACIITHDWAAGRLAGLWHLHPPSWGPDSLVGAAPPSPDDRQIARTSGQFLTIVFRPDGFDLHDLQTSMLGPPPPESSDRLIEYRSEDWRAHFASAHAEWKERLTTSPSR